MGILRRHVLVVTGVGLLGLAAGVGFTVLKPPLVTGNALVQLSTSSSSLMATQELIADSYVVLTGALPNVDPPTQLVDLRNRVRVKGLTASLMSISADGKTAVEADRTANAVAESYVSYVEDNYKSSKLQAKVFQRAINATGTTFRKRVIITGVLGTVVGLLLGAIVALAIGRGDRRLRLRDEIADAIGIPVLASFPVLHPANAGRWNMLFDTYEPNVAHAWRLRNALRDLGLPDVIAARNGDGADLTVTVLTLSSDRWALALGPQVAAFAAAHGVPTMLVIGPPHDSDTTAALRTACASVNGSVRRAGNLQIAIDQDGILDQTSSAVLTVVVAVVDARMPMLDGAIRTRSTVLGVSAGAATAEQLARVAASAAADGRQIDGVLVADPDPSDTTTGRIPQMVRPMRRIQPMRVVGLPTESRRRARER